MNRIRTLTFAFVSLLLLSFAGAVTPAAAQATRTWVSGVGDDANPCSRTAPCKTFAGAISKTAVGGEINCLDPGGFGGVTIIKSISIVCDHTEGGVLSAGAGVNGIVVNLPAATDTVFLSGLDLNGAGNAQNGLRVVSGGIVHLQNSIIRNYRASGGLGISYQPAGNGRLFVRNSTIADNGTGATGGGVLIQPTGAGGNARVIFENVSVSGNSNNGIRVDTTGNTSGTGVVVNITESDLVGSTNGISVNAPPGASSIELTLTDSDVYNNSTAGIAASGSGALLRVTDNTITANGVALSISAAGQIFSYGGNITDGNSSASTFSGTIGKN